MSLRKWGAASGRRCIFFVVFCRGCVSAERAKGKMATSQATISPSTLAAAALAVPLCYSDEPAGRRTKARANWGVARGAASSNADAVMLPAECDLSALHAYLCHGARCLPQLRSSQNWELRRRAAADVVAEPRPCQGGGARVCSHESVRQTGLHRLCAGCLCCARADISRG